MFDGTPLVRGTRLSVEFVFGLFGEGWTAEQILAECPSSTPDSLRAVLPFAGEAMRNERVFTLLGAWVAHSEFPPS